MKYAITVFVIVVFYTFSFAQSYRGVVTDSATAKPMAMATISVLEARDSTLLAYSVSDKNGAFVIRNLPSNTNLKAIVTYVGYKNYRKLFSVKPNESFDDGTISLSVWSNNLAEIVISSEIPPIVVRNDTIEFNASAFKTRSNALVEELLKKLPGMEIDNDGLITFNGKKVSKVLVNSKDFFSGDPRIATRNLNAEYVEKVQISDDKETHSDKLGNNIKVEKILNLTLKKKYKIGFFGKIYGSLGNKNRYEAGTLLNVFRDTLQLSIIASSNNSNQSSFSFNELRLLGILERGGFENLKNVGNGLSFNGISFGGIDNGLQKVTTAGFNVNYDWTKISKLNLQYFFTHVDNRLISKKSREQFLADTTFLSNYEGEQAQKTIGHSISGIYRWTPNSNTVLKYSPLASFNQSSTNANNNQFTAYNTLDDVINNSFSGQNQDNTYFKYKHSFVFFRRFGERRNTINIVQSTNINPTSGVLLSDVTEHFFKPVINSNTYLQQRSETLKSYNNDIDATLRVSVAKNAIFYFNTFFGYFSKRQSVYTYQQSLNTGNYDIFLSDQSNLLHRNELSIKNKLGLSLKFSKDVQLDVDLNGQFYFLNNIFFDNKRLNQRFLFWTPSLNFSTEDFSIKYGMRVIQPDISYLQPIKNTNTPLFVFQGNQDLKPTQAHAIYLDYYKFNNKTKWIFNGNISGEIYKDGIVVTRKITANGVENDYPINQNGQYSLNYSWSAAKTFKKKNGLQYTLSTTINGANNKNKIIVNEQNGWQYNNVVGLRERFYFAYRTLFSISPSYEINYTVNNYRALTYASSNYYTHIARSLINLNWPEKISWDIDYNYLYNSRQMAQFRRPVNLLNASVSLLILPKEAGQVKLTVSDVLNQNVNYQVISNQNYIDITQTNLLRRYFLLKFLYNFRK